MFAYTTNDLNALETVLSSDRLRPYARAAGNRDAMARYVWNVSLASAFYGPIQALEVALRNALHRELQHVCGRADWYRTARFRQSSYDLSRALADAGNRLVRDGKLTDPSHVVAALHFEFWTTLLESGPNGNRVRHLWNAGLHEAFRRHPAGARANRGSIYNELLLIKRFRNRIAHHEPIHNKHPEREFQRIITVADWIDAALPRWIAHHSRCNELLADVPYPRQTF